MSQLEAATLLEEFDEYLGYCRRHRLTFDQFFEAMGWGA